MRILITGGTGFLGRHCAVRLSALGHEITVFGRNEGIGKELENCGIRFIRGNLEDSEAVYASCKNQEQVIHAGALNARSGPYSAFYNANVLGTKHVIRACFMQGVERLIYLSTPILYLNNQHRLGIMESEPLPKPRSAYAVTKSIAEKLIDEASEQGLACISLRPRAIIGLGDKNIFNKLIAAKNKSLYLPNGGKSMVDITYIDNAVDAVLLAISANKEAFGKKFNITNGEPMTLYSLVELVSKNLNLNIKIRSIPFFTAYVLASIYEVTCSCIAQKTPPITREMVRLMGQSQTLDIRSAQKVLGYIPRVSLSDGLAQCLSHHNR